MARPGSFSGLSSSFSSPQIFCTVGSSLGAEEGGMQALKSILTASGSALHR